MKKNKIRYRLLGGVIFVLLLVGLFLSANFYSDIPVEKLKEKYAPPPSRFLAVNGQQVHYRDEGKGVPLVLLHGTAASLHTWDDWVTELKDSFRIIRFDLPAFGLTGPLPSRDYSTQNYVKFVDDFISKLDVPAFHLVGNSLGGNIAWNYAAKYPQKVKKLILIAPSGIPIPDKQPPLAFKLAAKPSLQWIVRHVTPRRMIRHSLEEVYADDSKVSDQLVNRYHDLLRRSGNRTAFIDRVQQIAQEDSTELGNIKSPVLLQWGKEDLWLPVSMQARFAKLLPNVTSVTYPNVGHVPMEESPIITAKDAKAFLRPIISISIAEKPILLKR